MMKKCLAYILAFLMLFSAAMAEGGWLPDLDQPDAVEDGTSSTVYDAANSAGTVVNGEDPSSEFSQEEQITYSITPLDVVLVLDRSGSMARTNNKNGKELISYAQDAAIAFCNTLFSLNPASRVAVVSYSSDVQTNIGLTGFSGKDSILSAIRSITANGTTNTGGGYAEATNILSTQSQPGRNQVVLMLSDGLANVGGADPIQYAIDQGTIASGRGLVYTIGLVGGMSESDKVCTRKVLNDGYATRYYEVDFENDVGDISVKLASAFVSIAVGGSVSEGEVYYRLWIDGSMDVRIENGSSEVLSSAPEDYNTSASFGAINIMGDAMDQKLVMLCPGDYIIRTHGTTTGTSDVQVTAISSNGSSEHDLLNKTYNTTPSHCLVMTIVNNVLTVNDESYEPLDITAVDPFTGKLTRGSEYSGTAYVKKSVNVMGSPDRKSVKIYTFSTKTLVDVLARSQETGSYFIGFADKSGTYSRGWVSADNLTNISGYIPNMIWIDPETSFTLTADVQSRRAPGEYSTTGDVLKKDTEVVLKHVEYDAYDVEWAYVQTTTNKGATCISYIPTNSLSDWFQLAPDDFMIAYGTPRTVWQQKLGSNNFTEVMWAASQEDGSGVVLSGRTSSTKGVLKAKYKERDSFAMLLNPDGSVGNVVTHGGNGWDSYHCILPVNNGYYVSGVTRSNDNDFQDIWDPASHSNKTSKTTKRTLALVGRLNAELEIEWLKSFGVGEVTYGFDMVVTMADGNIAGAGWLTDSSSGTISSSGKQDFYVVKLTPEGEVIKRSSFGWGNNDVPDSAVATPDGGLIMVGSTGNYALIVVYDQDLQVTNYVTYGGHGENNFDNIRLLPDGTYLATGYTSSSTYGGVDFWAMNIDSLGRCIWTKCFGGSEDEELCGTTVLADGRCILVGKTKSKDGLVHGASTASNQTDAWAICIDTTGRVLWQYTYAGKGNDYFNSAALDETDGGIVLVGVCDRSSDKSASGLAVKVIP